MIRSVVVVVIMADLLLTVAAAVAATTTPAPLPITYYCDSTLKPTEFVYDLTAWKATKDDFSYAIAPSTKSLQEILASTDITHCIQNFTAFKTEKAKVTGCTFLPTEPMQLYLDKAKTGESFIGGKSFETYSLPCDMDKTGKVTVKKDFAAPSPPTTLAAEIPNILTMDVKDAQGDSQNSFLVGEAMTVTISVTHTTHTYYLRIEECKAGPDELIATPVLLVTGEKSVEPDIIPDTESLGSPKGGQDAAGRSIHFTMYAFRFFKQDTVYLQCTVKVCLTELNCAKTTPTPLPVGRKRRSANDKSLDVTTTHFTVHEKDETSSGQTLGCPSLSAFTILVLLICRCMV